MPPSMRMFKHKIMSNYRSNSRLAKVSFAVASKKTEKWYGFCNMVGRDRVSIVDLLMIIIIWD